MLQVRNSEKPLNERLNEIIFQLPRFKDISTHSTEVLRTKP